MTNKPLEKPTYSIDTVDNALRLIQVLRDEGTLRLTEAAQLLGVANSTAHRLLSMLVYRGFAELDESHRYVVGPSVGAAAGQAESIRQLRLWSQPHLELLSSRVGLTVNLLIRVGLNVRMLLTVEHSNFFRIGDRRGSIHPALSTAGGKVLLSSVSPETLTRLYRSDGALIAGTALSDVEFAQLLHELAIARRRGYGVSRGNAELDVWAVSMPVMSAAGGQVAAFTVCMRRDQFTDPVDQRLLDIMLHTQEDLRHAIRTIDFSR